MEELKVGHYWIVIGTELVPARFDGTHFHSEKGKHNPDHTKVKGLLDLPPQCQSVCKCTVNPDGSITIDCP